MAEEILNKKVGDAVVTSQVVSVKDTDRDAQPTPRKRGRKPGTHKKQAQPAEAAAEPTLKANGRQPIWLSTLVNLVLLIAIFTIILATHRAIQNSRHAPEVVKNEPAETVTVTATEPEQPAEVEPVVAPAQPAEQVVAVAQEEKPKEPACDPVVPKKVVPKRSSKKIPFADLDLSKNPWNSGGEQDLDNNTIRQEYTKKNYLSSAEPDNK